MITVEVNDTPIRFFADPSRAELNTYYFSGTGDYESFYLLIESDRWHAGWCLAPSQRTELRLGVELDHYRVLL